MSTSTKRLKDLQKAFRDIGSKDDAIRSRRVENYSKFKAWMERGSALSSTGERPNWDNPCVIGEHQRWRT